MGRPAIRQISGHAVVEVQTPKSYNGYDRLVLRTAKGRTIWTVLSCERADKSWNITAIRCPSGCQIHRRRR